MTFLIIFLNSVLVGCQALPSDAPKELLTAQKAMDDMDHFKSRKFLPHTASFAQKKFEQSLELYKDSRKTNSLVSEDDAIREAKVATQYASAVVDLAKKMNEWDKNRANFQEALAFLDAQETGLLVAASSEPVSPLAKLSGTDVVTTLGFFEAGSASDPIIAVDEFESILDILYRDDSITITLIGSTDPNQTSEKDKGLAMERAFAIAKKLEENGIDRKRIALKTMPLNSKLSNEVEHPSPLPWNRRVVARITLIQ